MTRRGRRRRRRRSQLDAGFDRGDGDEHRVLDDFGLVPGGVDDVVDLERQERQLGIVAVQRAVVRAEGRRELDVALDEQGAREADAGPRGELEDARRRGMCRGALAVAVDVVDEQGLGRDDDGVGLGDQAAARPQLVVRFLRRCQGNK